MPVKRYDIKFGLLFGACLFAAGLVMQFLCGPIEWQLLASPVNIIVLVVYLAAFLLLHFCLGGKSFVRWLSSMSCATSSLIWCAAMTVLMGLLRQRMPGGYPVAWPGFRGMASQWSFFLIYFWLCTSVLMALFRLTFPLAMSLKKLAFICSHLGIVTILVAATLGSADRSAVKLQVEIGQTVWNEGVAVKLKDFEFEAYDDGTPKAYRSIVAVHMPDGTSEDAVIEVNRPYSAGGMKIYQAGYDKEHGRYSVLEVVRDPWFPVVLAGILLTLLGAFMRFFRK